MTVLDEVPGARERPGGCRIEVTIADDGASTITIPARGLPPLLLAGVMLLVGNLLLVLYTGIMLLLAHRSVLFMGQIAPGDLPASMHPLRVWLAPALVGVEALGGLLLAIIVRPSVTQERIGINRDEVWREQRIFGRTRLQVIPRPNVRGFHLRRDPQGLVAGVLTLWAGGERIEFAEFVSETDREWLASVGNALLQR